MIDRRAHWEKIHGDREPDEVSWHQETPALSLELIRRSGVSKKGAVLDVGGGASRLVDALLDDGFESLSVLDISGRALARARERLGARAEKVRWIEADITTFASAGVCDLWHDRAVFHFLIEESDRERYVEAVRRTLKPGGSLVVAAFAPDGPERCSGMPVRRYDANLWREAFGDGFELLREATETHVTPWKAEQKFSYVLFKRGLPSFPD